MSDTFFGSVTAFLKRQGRALRMARAGNVAMIFALAVIPVLVAGGAGIDLARALAVRARMYEAVDAAALAVASKSGITQAQATVLAQQYFDANFNMNNSYGTPAPITVVVDPATQQVDVSTTIAMPTTIMNVAGFQNVNLSAASKVVWGQTKIWVGLALDNTGSMCEPSSSPCPTPGATTKIYALKAATKSLLTMFKDASPNAGDVQVSLIPFSRDVRVDTGYASAGWIDWREWDETHGSCMLNGSANSASTKTACLAATTSSCSNTAFNASQNSCLNAGTCTISGNTTKTNCESAGVCSTSSYTTQSACSGIGTCTIAGNTTKNSCEAAYNGVCSLSAYTTQTNCLNAGTCSVAGYTTKSTCQAAYNGYVCKINGVSYTDANHDTSSECTTSSKGVCSKTPAATYNTKNKCQANPSPGTWYVGVWTGIGGLGVWTPATWTNQYGVWTATPGTWTTGVWTSAPGTWTTYNGVWTATHVGWSGCITDRGDTSAPSNPAYDTLNTTPGTPPASGFPASSHSACPGSALTGLGYDWTDLETKVDAMVANGNTNQTIGLAWAWQSLSQGAPLSPPTLPSGTVRHIIILSDGENTQNRWSSTRSTIDARMNTLCSNAKDDKVIIWSVFVNIAGGAGNAQSMKDCATGGATGGHYCEATSNSQINACFSSIGQQITNLRVAH